LLATDVQVLQVKMDCAEMMEPTAKAMASVWDRWVGGGRRVACGCRSGRWCPRGV